MGEPLEQQSGEVDPIEERIENALGARFFTESGFEARLIGRQVANLVRRMPMSGHKLIALSQFEGVAAGDPGNIRALGFLGKLLVSLQKPTHKS